MVTMFGFQSKLISSLSRRITCDHTSKRQLTCRVLDLQPAAQFQCTNRTHCDVSLTLFPPSRSYFTSSPLRDETTSNPLPATDDLGFLKEDIDNLMEICKVSEGQLYNIRVTLLELGLEPSRIVNLLKNCPAVSKSNRNHIKQQYSNLHVLHLSQKEVRDVVEKCPLVLLAPTKGVRATATLLSSHFRDRELGKILTSIPEILCDPVDLLEKKIQYCTEEMSLTLLVAAKSKILSCDLTTLKLRHSFLKKVGLYVAAKPTPGVHINQKSKDTSPSISKIMLASEEGFIRMFPSLSEEEFTVYQQMYLSELDEDDDHDDLFSDYEDDGEPDDSPDYDKGKKSMNEH